MRKSLLASAALGGVLVGGILFNSPDARAILGVGDIVSDPTMATLTQAMQTAITQFISHMETAVTDKLTNIGDLLSDKLTAGFTQTANYAKAQVGAYQQITDASNTAMATYQRDLRNAALRDEHTLSPQACVALNMGQAITVSAGQSWRVRSAIGQYTDRRGEAGPGTPAYAGQGQAAAAITQLHLSRYCSQNEADAGLCTISPARENLDQRASSLMGVPAYAGQDGVNAANDFATNLVQPIVPAASRGDALTSVAGQDAEARRRGYNAKMSLARDVVNDIIASRAESVTLTAEQKQQQADQGLTQTEKSSWLGALELDVNRRAGNVAYAAALQGMPQATLLREVAAELAMGNYIGLANLKVAQQNAALNAALLATATEAERKPTASMPSPQMASQ